MFARLIPLDAVVITQHRSTIAAVLFFAFFLILKKQIRLSGLKEYLGVYAVGVLMGIHWMTFFHSMQVSSVAVGMISLFSYPVITVLIEPYFHGGKPTLKDLLAALCVLVGVVVMVLKDLFQLNTQGVGSSLLAGVFWGVTSAVFISLRNIIQKYKFNHIPSDSLMMHQVIAVAIMALPFADMGGVAIYDARTVVLLVLLGLVSTAFGHTLLSTSLKILPAKTVAIISCAQPVIAVILAWLVLAEWPNIYVLLGGTIIISVAVYESISQSNQSRA